MKLFSFNKYLKEVVKKYIISYFILVIIYILLGFVFKNKYKTYIIILEVVSSLVFLILFYFRMKKLNNFVSSFDKGKLKKLESELNFSKIIDNYVFINNKYIFCLNKLIFIKYKDLTKIIYKNGKINLITKNGHYKYFSNYKKDEYLSNYKEFIKNCNSSIIVK